MEFTVSQCYCGNSIIRSICQVGRSNAALPLVQHQLISEEDERFVQGHQKHLIVLANLSQTIGVAVRVRSVLFRYKQDLFF